MSNQISFQDNSDIENSLPFIERVKSKPWQVDALAKSLTMTHFALFLEQGLGKTKVGIDRAFTLWVRGKITGVLVLSLKGVHRQWIREQLPAHAPMDYAAFEWPFKILPPAATPGDSLRFLAMNIDAISASLNGFKIAKQFIEAHGGRVLIIIDESHTIKNIRSRRSKEARKLGRLVTHRMIMTGTPLGKNLEEEWAQLLWLDPTIIGIEHVTVFRREYCIMGGFEQKEIVGHRNLERWRKKTEPSLFHFTKAQAGIEAKMRGRWQFDMTADQLRMVRQLKQGLLTEIRAGTVASAANAAVAVMRINQIASGFLTDTDGKVTRLFDKPEDNPRLAAMKEIAETNDGKIAVWGRFREDINMLMEMFGDEAVRYDGSVSDKERTIAVDRFLNDPSVRFFVSNPRVGGTGLNLQGGCNLAVYYSHVDGAITRWQSEDRIHRLGTVGVVNYIDIVGRYSFDKRILKTYDDGRDVLSLAMPDLIDWLSSDE